VKGKVPDVVGVPLRTPAEENVTPGGSVPPDKDHVYVEAPPPPVAVNVWE
jgi:hypothetical protein